MQSDTLGQEIIESKHADRQVGKSGAVVLGGDYHGLGIVRSLARARIPIVVVDHELAISRFSRYPQGFFRSPSANDELGFIRFLMQFAREKGVTGWVLYPTNDETVAVISRNKKLLESRYIVPTPKWDVVKHFYDKRLTHKLAVKLGIDVPKTYVPGDKEALFLLDVSYPAIVKPAIRDHFYPATKSKAILANNINELVKAFESASSVIDLSEILVQEVIPGGPEHLYAFSALSRNGRILAGLVARRSRQHPMDFGHASTYVETVDIPELEVLGSKILAAVGYSGLSEVEFKYDVRDCKYKFLEVNARTWGWHSIGARAGVDFPYLQYLDLMGKDARVNGFKPEVKWIRLATDLPTVAREILKRRLGIREYLRSWTGEVEFAVFSLSDPLPFLAEFFMAAYLYKRRGF